MSEVLQDIQAGLEKYSNLLRQIDEFFAAFGGEGEASLWQGEIPSGLDLFEAGGYNEDFPSADTDCWGRCLQERAWVNPYSLTPGQDGFQVEDARRYAYLLAAGSALPVIDVVWHPEADLYLIGDGHHRTMASIATGRLIRANIYEWSAGDKW